MLKNIISFLLFVFFTQTVLAGIDMHNGSDNIDATDIIEHYVDVHIEASQCQFDLETGHHDNLEDDHQHSCHGHTTSFPFSDYSLPNLKLTRFYSDFMYVFSEHSTALSIAYRPPIVS